MESVRDETKVVSSTAPCKERSRGDGWTWRKTDKGSQGPVKESEALGGRSYKLNNRREEGVVLSSDSSTRREIRRKALCPVI